MSSPRVFMKGNETPPLSPSPAIPSGSGGPGGSDEMDIAQVLAGIASGKAHGDGIKGAVAPPHADRVPATDKGASVPAPPEQRQLQKKRKVDDVANDNGRDDAPQEFSGPCARYAVSCPSMSSGRASVQPILPAQANEKAYEQKSFTESFAKTQPSEKSKKNRRLKFPDQLRMMLNFATKQDRLSKRNGEFCIAWTPDGKHIRIRDRKQFIEDVLPRFFKKTQYASFVRKLYRWGFQRLNLRSDVVLKDNKDLFTNPHFTRDAKQRIHHYDSNKFDRSPPAKERARTGNFDDIAPRHPLPLRGPPGMTLEERMFEKRIMQERMLEERMVEERMLEECMLRDSMLEGRSLEEQLLIKERLLEERILAREMATLRRLPMPTDAMIARRRQEFAQMQGMLSRPHNPMGMDISDVERSRFLLNKSCMEMGMGVTSNKSPADALRAAHLAKAAAAIKMSSPTILSKSGASASDELHGSMPYLVPIAPKTEAGIVHAATNVLRY